MHCTLVVTSAVLLAICTEAQPPPPPPPPSPVRGLDLPESEVHSSKQETNKDKCLVAIDEVTDILTHTREVLTDAQGKEGTAAQHRNDIAGTAGKVSGIISQVKQLREQRKMQLINAASDDVAAPESHDRCLSALSNLKEQIQKACEEVYICAQGIGDAKLMFSYGRLMGVINKWERIGKPGSSA
ncbi:unnamed protein product [Gongylonema pulchrum]|uniref:Secreted protein n=1 Tax=Gongylonema pulchrum TaxID=637853 RepID=A0A183DB99_9BILA|nr:unnamed protein product [Gongylonema pulchrum]